MSKALPKLSRFFTRIGCSAYDTVTWERRQVQLLGADGASIFAQADVEVPTHFSALATQVVAAKYFRVVPTAQGTLGRENSVRSLFRRVVERLTQWAERDKFFADATCLQAFHDELLYLLLHQMAAFNSPVWFNVGVVTPPQCSACFINSAEDDLGKLLDLAKIEGLLFKHGSGSGSNLSALRGKHEALAGGGTASGPVSFMRGFDAFAGAIKSGGTTRRAAKMVILNIDHPDIEEFIACKAVEEKKAWALMAAGYSGSVDGEAYGSVFFQNANHSVRLTDAFMQAVAADAPWNLRRRHDGGVCKTLPARLLMQQLADCAHLCGDPGVQFHDTINSWHTCAHSGAIEASNPCSEYLFLNDSACNLASLNLMKFLQADGTFDAAGFAAAVRVVFMAQELLVDHAGYPTAKIGANSRRFRPIGLGYANLGAYLMAQGLPYDSAEARTLAANITALMTGTAYATSAAMAQALGAFAGYRDNAVGMQGIMARHAQAAAALTAPAKDLTLHAAAQHSWVQAQALGAAHGFRHAQATVLAPTGTIAFLMDCDTTGIEPEMALVKHKKLVGGGVLRLVNRTVPQALARLGYAGAEAASILAHIEATGAAAGCPQLRPEHLAVFDCSLAAEQAPSRRIAVEGHLLMMAAVQPFLSGAISKTVNLPATATAAEVQAVMVRAHALGLKAVAIYRDGCKKVQPLSGPQGRSAAAPAAALSSALATALSGAPAAALSGAPAAALSAALATAAADTPPCSLCGAPLVRLGPCYRCENCGSTTACG